MGDDSASGKSIARGKAIQTRMYWPLYKDRLSSLYEGTVTGLYVFVVTMLSENLGS